MHDVLKGKECDPYTNCNQCNTALSHCNCMCHYCGKRDDCDCVLFDTVTGG